MICYAKQLEIIINYITMLSKNQVKIIEKYCLNHKIDILVSIDNQ